MQYFRAHFLQVHRRNNENRRVLYTHFTSVVVRPCSLKKALYHVEFLFDVQDTKTTQRIIGNGWFTVSFVGRNYLMIRLNIIVRDSIFRGYLQSAALV